MLLAREQIIHADGGGLREEGGDFLLAPQGNGCASEVLDGGLAFAFQPAPGAISNSRALWGFYLSPADSHSASFDALTEHQCEFLRCAQHRPFMVDKMNISKSTVLMRPITSWTDFAHCIHLAVDGRDGFLTVEIHRAQTDHQLWGPDIIAGAKTARRSERFRTLEGLGDQSKLMEISHAPKFSRNSCDHAGTGSRVDYIASGFADASEGISDTWNGADVRYALP